MNLTALIITIISSLSFFVGYIITKFIKNEKKLVIFSTGFAFVIILGLILFHLLPECLELISNKLIIVLCVIAGILILKALDYFIPDHNHSHGHDHIEHIGIISSLALILHNVIEGTALYTTSTTDIKLGIIMAIGVAFHNIPLGIQISSMIKNNKNKLLMIILLVVSCIIGPILLNLIGITLDTALLGVLISITLGMLIYISMFELLCEIKEHKKNKEMLYGVIIGLILIIVHHFIG